MWLRSDKRELRIRNQPKTKFHRKKRNKIDKKYSKTIKLMKNEKKASVLSTSQYSADELTLYDDKTIKAKKPLNATSKLNQFGTISYDLNTLDIDLNLRTNTLTSQENISYDSSNGQTQYDFDCTYPKGTTEIQAVADLILKSKLKSCWKLVRDKV